MCPTHAFSERQTIAFQGVAAASPSQGFGWDACEKGGYWNIVKEKIPDIASAGFTHVWLPPPSESVAPQVRYPCRFSSASLV